MRVGGGEVLGQGFGWAVSHSSVKGHGDDRSSPSGIWQQVTAVKIAQTGGLTTVAVF